MTPDRSVGAREVASLLSGWTRERPAYRSLAAELRRLVLDGRLPLRTRLPAERETAAALGVSRTTVTAAYDALRATGYLVSRRGSGSWTALPEPERASAPAAYGPAEGDDVIDVAIAAPAGSWASIGAALEAATAELACLVRGHGYEPRGLPRVREAIAERFTARGLPTRADEILVTSGAQHAWSLVLRLFARPGERVLVESPTYPHAHEAVRAAGARPVPVPVDAGGWDLGMVEATLRQAAPRLAYVIADHHNPTGHVATAAERAALVDAARRTGTLVVVDETLAELTLDPVAAAGPGAAPVAAYDAGGSVITLGSASKTWWGGLRVGWVRANPDVVRDLAAVRATGDLATAVLEQLVVAQLLGQGEEPLRARRRLLAEQRDAALAALAAAVPAWRVARPAGGLSLWAELPDPVSSALAVAAARHGVHLAPGPRFGVDGTLERFLRVPFALPAPVLREAIRRLATAYDDVAGTVAPAVESTLAV